MCWIVFHTLKKKTVQYHVYQCIRDAKRPRDINDIFYCTDIVCCLDLLVTKSSPTKRNEYAVKSWFLKPYYNANLRLLPSDLFHSNFTQSDILIPDFSNQISFPLEIRVIKTLLYLECQLWLVSLKYVLVVHHLLSVCLSVWLLVTVSLSTCLSVFQSLSPLVSL